MRQIAWICWGAILLWCCPAGRSADRPTRETIELRIDRNVQSSGHYAVVRLPLKTGAVLWNPTAIQFSPGGVPFGVNYTGEVFRLVDTDGDGLEDQASLFCDIRAQGSKTATCLAFLGGEVLVGTDAAILAYRDTDGDGRADESRTFLKLPHGGSPYDWIFGLQPGPGGRLYAAIPTDSYYPGYSADPERWRGALLSMAPDGTDVRTLATGLRFPYGLAFTGDGELYFTDNEGGGNPTEELNRYVNGAFYGHNPSKFENPKPTTPPLIPLREGRGATGIAWNPATNDFDRSGGSLFVAYYGKDQNWAEGTISRVRLLTLPDGSRTAREESVIRQLPKPTGIAFSPSGDLYVASLGVAGTKNTPGGQPSGAYYRVIHAPWVAPVSPQAARRAPGRGNPIRGGIIFTNLGCASCHPLAPGTSGFGPGLAGLGETFFRDEVLQAVTNPSVSIRTGFEGFRIDRVGEDSVTGWVVTSDADSVTLQTGSDRQARIPRAQISEIAPLSGSLMPDLLLDGQGRAAIDDLMAFLGVPPRPGRPWDHEIMNLLRGIMPGARLRTKLLVMLAAILAMISLVWRCRRIFSVKTPPS